MDGCFDIDMMTKTFKTRVKDQDKDKDGDNDSV